VRRTSRAHTRGRDADGISQLYSPSSAAKSGRPLAVNERAEWSPFSRVPGAAASDADRRSAAPREEEQPGSNAVPLRSAGAIASATGDL
jgi:hypothetical protein